MLVTRHRRYADGLAMIERALAGDAGDPGLWYTAGWLYEFAAHESARRGRSAPARDRRLWYERAAECFRRCLALAPGGKLEGDAADLLDHVENELASL
ncbi:MAG TPA: hypothetical protein VNI78_06695 [Vicinamibacterales bacterium]|nr:hypothetical protein [Vicinamibacterales bacterium]